MEPLQESLDARLDAAARSTPPEAVLVGELWRETGSWHTTWLKRHAVLRANGELEFYEDTEVAASLKAVKLAGAVVRRTRSTRQRPAFRLEVASPSIKLILA